MKYRPITLMCSPAKHAVEWKGFQIETVLVEGAQVLAEEMNRLESARTSLKERADDLAADLAVQVEAKCKALKRVEELERQVFSEECERKAFQQRLGVRTSQVSRLLSVLESAQAVLANYLDPATGIKPRAALNHLLDILDDCALVTMMRNSRELIGVKDNGSVELTKADKLKVLKGLDDMASFIAKDHMVPASYSEACRILEVEESPEVANGSQKKLPEVGDEFLVSVHPLLGVVDVKPLTIQAGQAYINGACIEKSAVSATELGAAITEPVVNNTTNYFAPDKKLTNKQRQALRDCIGYFEPLGGPENLAIVKQFRKLLKKFS